MRILLVPLLALSGLVQYLFGRHRLGEAGRPPLRPASAPSVARIWILLAAGFILLLGLAAALRPLLPSLQTVGRIFDVLLPALSVLALAGLFVVGTDSVRERRPLAVIVILFVASALFWGCFEQAGSTLTLFASRHTDRNLSMEQFFLLMAAIPAPVVFSKHFVANAKPSPSLLA